MTSGNFRSPWDSRRHTHYLTWANFNQRPSNSNGMVQRPSGLRRCFKWNFQLSNPGFDTDWIMNIFLSKHDIMCDRLRLRYVESKKRLDRNMLITSWPWVTKSNSIHDLQSLSSRNVSPSYCCLSIEGKKIPKIQRNESSMKSSFSTSLPPPTASRYTATKTPS